MICFFFFKQKTAYEMRISDWSSDVCSSDLGHAHQHRHPHRPPTAITAPQTVAHTKGAGVPVLLSGADRDRSAARKASAGSLAERRHGARISAGQIRRGESA